MVQDWGRRDAKDGNILRCSLGLNDVLGKFLYVSHTRGGKYGVPDGWRGVRLASDRRVREVQGQDE